MKQKITAILVLAALFSLLSFSGCTNEPKETTPPTEAAPTEPAPTEPAPTEPTVPEGKEVGDRCISFDLQVVDENGATGETVNPAEMYKVTVLNFWGIWCKPCTNELPHFNQIIREYDVAVVAVHSRDRKEEMPRYIMNNYPDSPMIFAWDTTGTHDVHDEYYLAMCSSQRYPYTVIINEQGIITHTFDGAIDHETLAKAVEEAGAMKKELKVIEEAVTAMEDYFDLTIGGNPEKLETVVPQSVWDSLSDITASPDALQTGLPGYLAEVLEEEYATYGKPLGYTLQVTDCLIVKDEIMAIYQNKLQELYGLTPSQVPYGCSVTGNLTLRGEEKGKVFRDVTLVMLCIDGGWYVADCNETSLDDLSGASLIKGLQNYLLNMVPGEP